MGRSHGLLRACIPECKMGKGNYSTQVCHKRLALSIYSKQNVSNSQISKGCFFQIFDFHNGNSHHINQNYVTLAKGKEVKLGIIGGN